MDYSDDLPIFDYEYKTGGASEHNTGYLRPMTVAWDDPLSVVPAIADHLTSQEGWNTGDLILEKRAFMVPTGLPQTVFEGPTSGYLDVNQEFAVSFQQSHWFKKPNQAKFHNLTSGIEDFDYDRIGADADIFEYLLLERGRWSSFTDWYEHSWPMLPCKSYRTLIVYRAKYDVDEHIDFSSDVVVGSIPMEHYAIDEDGVSTYTGTSDSYVYEVFYTATTSPLKYEGQVLRNVSSSDTKTFASAGDATDTLALGETYPTHPTQTRPDMIGAVGAIADFFSASSVEVAPGAMATEAEGALSIAVTGLPNPTEWGEGSDYVTTYEYQTEELRTDIQVRYQIQEGHPWAVKEVFENFFGALTKQLAIQVGVDTIPRAYATKMQASRPLKMDLLSSMPSERVTSTVPTGTTTSTMTTTATTTGGSY